MTVGASITDTATLDPITAQGTVTFKVYGPDDATCSGAAVFTSADRTVTNGQAVSAPFAPTVVGSYRWIAAFTSANTAVWANTTGKCNDSNETSVVGKKQPTIKTNAAAGGPLPDPALTDVATVENLTANATGTVTFKVYGPDDATCAGTAVFTSSKPLGTVNAGTAVVTSAAFTPTAVGRYRWIASYGGDDNNKSVAGACNDTNEFADVTKRQPTISTDASPGGALPGVPLTDTATVANLTPDAGGTVTFALYGPNDATCATTPVFTTTATFTSAPGGVATVTSSAYTATAAGTYRWVASYGGDAKNKTVAGQCNDAHESAVVTPANPKIVTDAQDTASLPQATITDTATLSGLNPGATGSIVFRLYGPSATPVCNDSGAGANLVFTSSSVPVNHGNGTYGPVQFTVTKAGTYYWVASYNGDANNSSVSGVCGETTEISDVDKATTAISTRATTTAKLPDGTLKDTATVTGLTSDATGNVVFNLYGPSPTPNCSGPAKFTSTTPLGTVTAGTAVVESATFTPVAAGSYYWTATYEGDSNNKPAVAACGADNETSVVNPSQTAISTTASSSKLPGATIHDSATVTGLTATAGGTVTFTLFGPSAQQNCTGTPIFTATKPLGAVTGGSATVGSGSFSPNLAGTYWWIASYSGDADNTPATGACGDAGETSTVSPATPAISTTATVSAALPAGTLSDTATLTGLTAGATGTVSFRLYGPDPTPGTPTCVDSGAGANLVFTSGPTAITNNGNGTASAQSGSYLPTETGTYFWVASYSGDPNNDAVAGACGAANETSTVTKASPTIATTATNTSLPDGTIKDTATVSGLSGNAGGDVTFTLYGPSPTPDCTGTVRFTDTKPLGSVVGGIASVTSASYTPTQAGKYYWIASYSGDGNNSPVVGQCGDQGETSTVDKAAPAVTTQVAAPSVALPNASLVDTAILSGATTDPKATGTITFRLYGPFTAAPNSESCNGDTLLTTKVVGVTNGNGSYASPAVVVDAAGFYTWVATYSGDADNESATHPCAQESETVRVTNAPTSVATVATGSAVIKLGGSISDAATVTGLAAGATGTVTFALFGPDNATCSGTPVFTSTVALTVTAAGNGTATGSATSAAFTPTAAGTYRWIATYSGDGNNAASAGACNDPNEQSVVKAGDHPVLDKFSNPASGSTVQPGSTIHYSVKVSNTGDVAITDADVVDILPPHVTVDVSSISDGGVLSVDKSRITWKVTLAPADANSSADEKTLTYRVTVNANAPAGAVLVNTARFQGLEDTTTHVVPTGNLTLVKQVSPVAGNGVVVEFGDKLTYTLTASATGTLDQPNVVVTDYLPGSDPARPKSGDTTYVAGSAKCIGAGTCVVTGPDAKGLITWSLGSMAAGTSRQVTFQVTIDDVTGDAGETVAVDILNAGAVRSDRTPTTASNEVVTPVTKVLPVKIPRTPETLPHTGNSVPVGPSVGGALALITLGMLLVAVSRRRRTYRPSA